MTDDQITALAREYGEYVANSLDYDMCADHELRHRLVVKGHSESAQLVLEWLLRRYCLVEKSKVEEEYKKACESVNKHSATTGCLFFVGKKQTLESLFPEIAKEVDNE